MTNEVDPIDKGCPGTNGGKFDVARVEEFKTAIENDDYQIDSAAIADAMLRLERLLGQ